MKPSIALVAAAACFSSSAADNHEHRHSSHHNQRNQHNHLHSNNNNKKVKDALEWFGASSIAELPSRGSGAAPRMRAEDLPVAHDWRNVGGVRYATGSKTQQIPHICGACWAFAATGTLSDRVRIAAKGTPLEVDLSPQTLLNCHTDAGSCLGGNSLAAYASVYNSTTGFTDETCQPYEGVDYSNWGESDCADRMCKTADLYGNTYWVNGTRVFVDSYGAVDASDPTALMSEVYQNGPVACYMYAHSDSFEDYTGGVITDATAYPGITHVVALVGWGTDYDSEEAKQATAKAAGREEKTEGGGIDYWVVRNSFGTYWGEQGYYRVERGINAFNMESGVCEWATPTQESVDALVAAAALGSG